MQGKVPGSGTGGEFRRLRRDEHGPLGIESVHENGVEAEITHDHPVTVTDDIDGVGVGLVLTLGIDRSEERRVGKEC
jgi:hypothetical protein